MFLSKSTKACFKFCTTKCNKYFHIIFARSITKVNEFFKYILFSFLCLAPSLFCISISLYAFFHHCFVFPYHFMPSSIIVLYFLITLCLPPSVICISLSPCFKKLQIIYMLQSKSCHSFTFEISHIQQHWTTLFTHNPNSALQRLNLIELSYIFEHFFPVPLEQIHHCFLFSACFVSANCYGSKRRVLSAISIVIWAKLCCSLLTW